MRTIRPVDSMTFISCNICRTSISQKQYYKDGKKIIGWFLYDKEEIHICRDCLEKYTAKEARAV